MRTAPIISLILSIIVGIAAVVFGRGWLNNEAGATDGPAVRIQEVETQRILVADIAIARGELLSAVSFRQADWPVEHLPEGVVTDVAALLGEAETYPYALGVMVPGEPLLSAKLSAISVRDTLTTLIDIGYRAVAIEVDDATGVAGFVLPDHRVDVSLFIDDRDPISKEHVRLARTLMTDIRVLAVDQAFSENMEGAALARTVTLQVTPDQANELGLAAEVGTLGLALRPEKEPSLAVLPVAKAPPRRRRTPQPIPVKKEATIRVIEGDEETTVTTPVAGPGALSKGANR